MAAVVIFGVGLQGQAVAHELASLEPVDGVVAADLSLAGVAERLTDEAAAATKLETVDVADVEAIARLLGRHQPQVVVCMVPPALQVAVARAAIAAGAHFVSSSYTGDLNVLDAEARARGLMLLPEMGLDPGIDLLLCRLAVDELDEVRSLESYGGGLPEPAAAGDTPLRYKVSWTFRGVLGAYLRPARLRRGGHDLSIPGDEMFRPDLVHHEQVPSVGELEAYPNGDALRYIDLFGLDRRALEQMARYGLRYRGHSAFWYAAAQMGLLDEAPVEVDGTFVSPRALMAAVMEPRLRYGPEERDLVVLRARAAGRRDGREVEVVWDLVDRRDLDTGLFAMNRTVGFTAAASARLMLEGVIEGAGLLSPARHVPPTALLDHLARHGIEARRR